MNYQRKLEKVVCGENKEPNEAQQRRALANGGWNYLVRFHNNNKFYLYNLCVSPPFATSTYKVSGEDCTIEKLVRLEVG